MADHQQTSVPNVEVINISSNIDSARLDRHLDRIEAATERLQSIGPWPVRRTSTASVITSPVSRPGRHTGVSDPFTVAFGAAIDMDKDNIGRERFASEASSSTAVAEDGADISEISTWTQSGELTRTLSQADEVCDAVRNILDGERVALRNDDAERNRYERQRQRRRSAPLTSNPTNGPPAQEEEGIQRPMPTVEPRTIEIEDTGTIHVSWHYPRRHPPQPMPRTFFRGRPRYSEATLQRFDELSPDFCVSCALHKLLGTAGLWIVIASALFAVAGFLLLALLLKDEVDMLSRALKQKHHVRLCFVLLAIPFGSFCSVVVTAALVFFKLQEPRKLRLGSRWRFVKAWLWCMHGVMLVYFLIAGLIYHFTKHIV